ncbi:MAG: hypothetical protein Q9212_006177 [Teloschistes hypoglaucus]
MTNSTYGPPAFPPRKYSAVPTDGPTQIGIQKEYFDQRLGELHSSLKEIIVGSQYAVERALTANGSNFRTEMVQGNSEALIKALWTLLDPQQRTSLRDFTQDPVREIKERMLTLEDERDRLAVERQTFEDRINRASVYTAAAHETSRELAELRIQNRKLSEQNSRYRSIILQGSIDNTELPDDTIRNRFVELRDIVQRIIHRYYTAEGPMKLLRHNNPNFKAQEDFREDLTGFPTESLRKFYLRAKLFELLDTYLLSARNFGVGEYEGDLGRFERALHASKNASPVDVVEWRSRTIQCSAWLEQKSQRPGNSAKDILNFLEPQLSNTASMDLLGKSMWELCDKAYDLSLLMRRNKKVSFTTSSFNYGTVISPAIEAEVSCQAFDGRSEPDVVGSKIVMTIFGGLVKIPDASS